MKRILALLCLLTLNAFADGPTWLDTQSNQVFGLQANKQTYFPGGVQAYGFTLSNLDSNIRLNGNAAFGNTGHSIYFNWDNVAWWELNASTNNFTFFDTQGNRAFELQQKIGTGITNIVVNSQLTVNGPELVTGNFTNTGNALFTGTVTFSGSTFAVTNMPIGFRFTNGVAVNNLTATGNLFIGTNVFVTNNLTVNQSINANGSLNASMDGMTFPDASQTFLSDGAGGWGFINQGGPTIVADIDQNGGVYFATGAFTVDDAGNAGMNTLTVNASSGSGISVTGGAGVNIVGGNITISGGGQFAGMGTLLTSIPPSAINSFNYVSNCTLNQRITNINNCFVTTQAHGYLSDGTTGAAILAQYIYNSDNSILTTNVWSDGTLTTISYSQTNDFLLSTIPPNGWCVWSNNSTGGGSSGFSRSVSNVFLKGP